jgi:hypothetical protein
MVYTVEEDGKLQTYEGFCKALMHLSVEHELNLPPKEARFLGLVMWEDSICPWWLENGTLAVEELQRLYRAFPGVDAQIHLVPVSSLRRSK